MNNNLFLQFLDCFFLIFHTLFIVFNLFGWLFRPVRKLNLFSLLLTLASWLFLGIFYGFGYCPLTDWHFIILEKLGKGTGMNSYIQYLLYRLFHLDIEPKLVDFCTMGGLIMSITASLTVNIVKGNK